MKEKLKNIPHRRWTELGICTVLALLLLVWALALELAEPEREATAAQKRQFAVARVLDVLEDNAETQDWTEGRRIGQQYLEIEILTGDWKGAVLETVNYLTIYTNVDAKVGTRIIVRLEADETGAPYILSVPNYNRTPVLLGLIAVFALLLVVIGRRKGLMALLGLAYTLASVWFILIPMLLRGADPILTAIGIVALTTAASLILLTGLSRKTLCATLGCIGGVAAAGLFAALCGEISPLNGFNLTDPARLRPRHPHQRPVCQRHPDRLARRGDGRGDVHFLRLLGAARGRSGAYARRAVPLGHEHRPRCDGHDGKHAHSGVCRIVSECADPVSGLRLSDDPAF